MNTPQFWLKIGTLAALYQLSERTVRDYLKAGKFGDPTDTRFVICVEGELRVSGAGCQCFETSHPYRYDPAVYARNKAELAAKLKGGAHAQG